MARVGRLAGAILLNTAGEHFLIGNTKCPCDWASAGFEAPGELNPLQTPFVRLRSIGAVVGSGPWMHIDREGEELAALLANCFLIERNGSVSDRLWRLVLRAGHPSNDALDDDDDLLSADAEIDANWLATMPPHIWRIVRESVLRCL